MSAVREDSLRTPVTQRGGRLGSLAPRVVSPRSQYNLYGINVTLPAAKPCPPDLPSVNFPSFFLEA